MDELDDTEFNESEHNRLISAISKLDRTQHIKHPTRNEPTALNTEFSLHKRSNKLDIGEVVKVLENTGHHFEISKKLKKVQNVSNVLPKPLEKPQAERIKRSTGYEESKRKIGRWDSVVARSRSVDYVSFPLSQPRSIKQPSTNEPPKGFLSKFKLKSSLELELDEIDPPAPIIQNEEEETVYPMSYEEMVEQRQHMAKLRAQQSFKAAKAKRQSKIKSKKFHRVLKKEKMKQQLKEFEELQKTNPEEALNKLEALEKARALERHTLRHKNTGKWAKSQLIRAKYDKEVRQQLAEQLSVSRGLTYKAQDDSSTDDEVDNDERIPDVTLSQDPSNPWMIQSSKKSNVSAEFDFGYKKYLQNRMPQNTVVDSSSESEQETISTKTNYKNTENKSEPIYQDRTVESIVLSANKNKISNPEVQNKTEQDNKRKVIPVKEHLEKINIKSQNPSKKVKMSNNAESQKAANKVKAPIKAISTSDWIVDDISNVKVVSKVDILNEFETHESKIIQKVSKKLQKLRENIEDLERKPKQSNTDQQSKKEETQNNLEYLMFKSKKLKPIIDEELDESCSRVPTDRIVEKPSTTVVAAESVTKDNITEANIDPSRFIEAKPKYLNSQVSEPGSGYDQLDDDEQIVPKVNIEDVFEEDDVVASFRQEKDEEAKNSQPQDIDLSLPGWGSWGGKGVKASKRKRNRFILKAPPALPRRDENKGDIIINEYKDPKLAVHKVKEVPFPFTSVKEYEASIRTPIGNTFIPEKPHKLLIRPSVITKAGTIIEPMDEEQLLIPKNRSFKNKAVISYLAKK